MHHGNTATSLAMTEVLSPFEQSVPRTAATKAGSNAADVAAPMHGHLAVGGHHTGEVPRRLITTAPSPPPIQTDNLGKRSRGGPRTSTINSTVTVGNGTGLARGRPASGDCRHSNSIPSKSRRISAPDMEPVMASQLSVRRREAVAGLAVQCDPVSEDFFMQRAGGEEVNGGAQAVCGQPLVPQPSSPRAQGECHPW